MPRHTFWLDSSVPKEIVSGVWYCTCSYSVRFCSVLFGSVRFGLVRFGSVRFGSVRFCYEEKLGARLRSGWVHSSINIIRNNANGERRHFVEIHFNILNALQNCTRKARRYFQHAHFIPILGVGKRGEY